MIADNKEHEIKTIDIQLLRKCNQTRRNIKHQYVQYANAERYYV